MGQQLHAAFTRWQAHGLVELIYPNAWDLGHRHLLCLLHGRKWRNLLLVLLSRSGRTLLSHTHQLKGLQLVELEELVRLRIHQQLSRW